MRQRVAELRGTFQLESLPEKGLQIIITVGLPQG